MTPQFSVGSSCCVHVCLALHIMGPESAYLFMRLDPQCDCTKCRVAHSQSARQTKGCLRRHAGCTSQTA
jgi:hypothetical protein